MRNPYEVLGVPRTASEADIKKAFRGLAKKHHPDRHPNDSAAKKTFQEISGAYDILGDKDKRARFDAGEIDGAGNPRGFDPRAHGFRQGHPFGGGFGADPGNARGFKFSWDDIRNGGRNGGAQGGAQGNAQGGGGFEDIFADLMGAGRRRGGPPPQQRGEDFAANVTVSFDEAVRGGTRRVALQNGEQIDVRIPPGVKDGQVVRVKGRGGAGRAGAPNGDILLTVQVAPHPFLTRDGNDIRMDLPVTLQEAVLGGKVPVPTPSGTLSLTIPPGANSGTILRLKGKGVPAHGPRPAGDFYVRLAVSLPDKPDEALKRFVQGWDITYDPRAKLI